MRQRVGVNMPIIGVGGIDSAASAIAKIRAGADLVQLYTSMIYRGPGLAGEIVKEMSSILKRDGVSDIASLRDRDADQWAAKNSRLTGELQPCPARQDRQQRNTAQAKEQMQRQPQSMIAEEFRQDEISSEITDQR